MKKFLKLLQDLFLPRPLTDIEKFVASKNPQSPQEAEFWIAEYDTEQRLRNRKIALM